MQYAPVQIRNPVTQHHLVRLLPRQNIMLVFSKPEYRDVCIDVMGDFLALAKTESLTRNSIAMHYEQKFDLLDIGEGCSLSLGRISILSSAITASLCVVLSNDAHPDFIKIVNPAEDVCKLEP